MTCIPRLMPPVSGARSALRASSPLHLFAYDISEPKRARRVRGCLKRWRIDGQLSVHEAWLSPPQAEALAMQLLDYADSATDRLLLGRVGRHGGALVFVLSGLEPRLPVLGGTSGAWPARFQDGCYLLAYDIRDERRLRQVHKVSSRICVSVQRSVYLYQGPGAALGTLLETLGGLALRGVDDIRVYSLRGPEDLWFLCGPVPPLAEMNGLAGRAARPSGPSVCFKLPWEE